MRYTYTLSWERATSSCGRNNSVGDILSILSSSSDTLEQVRTIIMKSSVLGTNTENILNHLERIESRLQNSLASRLNDGSEFCSGGTTFLTKLEGERGI